MTKTITLETNPPVTIKLWTKGSKHFWAYDYPNCKPNAKPKDKKRYHMKEMHLAGDYVDFRFLFSS